MVDEGTVIAGLMFMPIREDAVKLEANMATATVEEDDDLKEIFSSGNEAFSALVSGETTARTTQIKPGMKSLLATPRTILRFRTLRWASFAGLQIARRGYVVAIHQRYVIVEAPWLLVCALVARIGLGTEVLNIRWENQQRPWGSSLSGPAAEG
jgi:hypothetical protein